MRAILNSVIICFFSLLSLSVESQILTEKDFHLSLDGYRFEDSTITVDQLLKVKRLTTNFSWLKIEEFSVFISGRINVH